MFPQKFKYSSYSDSDIYIFYLGISNIGNILIQIDEISVAMVFSEGTPATTISDDDLVKATAYFDALDDSVKLENGGIWREPDPYNFPDLVTYKEHLPSSNSYTLEDMITTYTEEYADALDFNDETDENKASRLGVFIRFFCEIEVLIFAEIQLAFIIENFADGVTPSKWALAGQFEASLAGLKYSVSVSSTIDFDRRRYRHLAGDEYSRALASNGWKDASFDASMSVICDGTCEAIKEFFEVGTSAVACFEWIHLFL